MTHHFRAKTHKPLTARTSKFYAALRKVDFETYPLQGDAFSRRYGESIIVLGYSKLMLLVASAMSLADSNIQTCGSIGVGLGAVGLSYTLVRDVKARLALSRQINAANVCEPS